MFKKKCVLLGYFGRIFLGRVNECELGLSNGFYLRNFE